VKVFHIGCLKGRWIEQVTELKPPKEEEDETNGTKHPWQTAPETYRHGTNTESWFMSPQYLPLHHHPDFNGSGVDSLTVRLPDPDATQ
jgi:hypothetical protein